MKKKSILLIDDEVDLLQALQELLEIHHYSVDCAQNVEEALRLTLAKKYDLIISDFKMPQLSGLDFLAQLPQNLKNQTPIIIMSAYSDLSEKEFLTQGARLVLSKPIRGLSLLNIIKDLIN